MEWVTSAGEDLRWLRYIYTGFNVGTVVLDERELDNFIADDLISAGGKAPKEL